MYKFMHIVIDTIIFVILPKDTGKQCYISLSFQLPSPPLPSIKQLQKYFSKNGQF